MWEKFNYYLLSFPIEIKLRIKEFPEHLRKLHFAIEGKLFDPFMAREIFSSYFGAFAIKFSYFSLRKFRHRMKGDQFGLHSCNKYFELSSVKVFRSQINCCKLNPLPNVMRRECGHPTEENFSESKQPFLIPSMKNARKKTSIASMWKQYFRGEVSCCVRFSLQLCRSKCYAEKVFISRKVLQSFLGLIEYLLRTWKSLKLKIDHCWDFQ